LGYQFESERKRALKSSLQLQADFQVLIEDSPEGVVVLADNSIVYANPGLATILKFTNDELHNNNFIEFAHPKIRSRLTESIENLRTPQGNEKRTFEFVRGDSETVKLEIDHISKINFNGASRTLVMLRDLSERSRLEAQMRITDRLSSVCSLAAGMAHEINNPIAFIKGNLEYIAEILEEKGLGKELEDVHAAVFESIEGVLRVATIVQDMQALARIQPKESSAIDLSGTVHSAIKLTSHETTRRAKLVVDIAENLIVVADAANLHQILINLLINAAEAMPEELHHENTLRVTCVQRDEHTALVEIHDSGPGIPEDKLAEVFDPFYTTKEVGQGTGLGLSSSRQLVSAMNGTLELENHADGGLVARMILPSH
ncbi:MAG: PAS domain S-box protein, partial [Kofleriaceae bacterium]|nr:PAS domain S-box protein [Kofleriaceae bacterium]